MSSASTYPASFAGPRRASHIDATTKATGEPAWKRPVTVDGPPKLVVWGGHVAVVGRSQIESYGALGDPLPVVERRSDSPVGAREDKLYTQNKSRRLALTTDAGTVAEADPLVGAATTEILLDLLWPLASEYVAVGYLADPKYDSESDEPVLPEAWIRAVPYGARTGRVGRTVRGRLALPSIYVPETNEVLIAHDEDFVRVSLTGKAAGEPALHPWPLGSLTEWSADARGRLHVLGEIEGRATYLVLNVDGSLANRFASATGAAWAPSQPPIVAPGGRSWVLTTSRVLAFDDGAAAWSRDLAHGLRFDALETPIPPGLAPANVGPVGFATALGDGSLLVTAGERVFHLDAQGQERFHHTCDEAIVAPPVVDGAGHVCVVTSRQLTCLQ